MHPDQFVVINSPRADIVERRIGEFVYHLKLMENLGTGKDAKIQIHISGAYGNKKLAIERFARNFEKLPQALRERLVIENDKRIFNLNDFWDLSNKIGIPVVADYFHFKIHDLGEEFSEILKLVIKTWRKEDGNPIVDYSSSGTNKTKGAHAHSIDLEDFSRFIQQLINLNTNFDVMLKIKNKEKSALKAISFLKS